MEIFKSFFSDFFFRSYKLLKLQWVTKLLKKGIVFLILSWTPNKDLKYVWTSKTLMQFLITRNIFLDKPVLTFPRCKYDVHVPKDSRRSLRLAGGKYVEVTINNLKGDGRVIFTMMDNPEMHKVPNGYQQSDGVPTPQRESLQSTTWAEKIEW